MQDLEKNLNKLFYKKNMILERYYYHTYKNSTDYENNKLSSAGDQPCKIFLRLG